MGASNMACVPQFDTMHPGVSLGANFNDRIWKAEIRAFSTEQYLTAAQAAIQNFNRAEVSFSCDRLSGLRFCDTG